MPKNPRPTLNAEISVFQSGAVCLTRATARASRTRLRAHRSHQPWRTRNAALLATHRCAARHAMSRLAHAKHPHLAPAAPVPFSASPVSRGRHPGHPATQASPHPLALGGVCGRRPSLAVGVRRVALVRRRQARSRCCRIRIRAGATRRSAPAHGRRTTRVSTASPFRRSFAATSRSAFQLHAPRVAPPRSSFTICWKSANHARLAARVAGGFPPALRPGEVRALAVLACPIGRCTPAPWNLSPDSVADTHPRLEPSTRQPRSTPRRTAPATKSDLNPSEHETHEITSPASPGNPKSTARTRRSALHSPSRTVAGVGSTGARSLGFCESRTGRAVRFRSPFTFIRDRNSNLNRDNL